MGLTVSTVFSWACDFDESSLELLMAIDSTIQFGEDADVKDRYPAEEDPADCQ